MGFSYKTDKLKSDQLNQLAASHLSERLNADVTLVDIDRSPVEAILDQQCGVDALVQYNGATYGAALRVQEGRNWGTFTIRTARHTGAETELLKTKRLLKTRGALRPQLTLQAYVDKDHIAYGLAMTDKLFAWIAEQPLSSLSHLSNGADGNRFMVVDWRYLMGQPWFTTWSVKQPKLESNYE